jgi:hypothetical protein
MDKPSSKPQLSDRLEEFVDKAIDDPAELTALGRTLRRPMRVPAWVWWLVGVGVAMAALLAGFFGRPLVM